jgi:uncharacterized protein YndB with AHSA1/START domain
MATYRFVTEWQVAAPIDAVWEELTHPDAWPTWWKGVEKVERIEPEPAGVASLDGVGEQSSAGDAPVDDVGEGHSAGGGSVDHVGEQQSADSTSVDHIGERRRYTWKSRLPYRLVFEMTLTRSERPHLLEGHATGELEGTGTWTLSERDGGTRVRYVWAVRTTRPWMNVPLPFLRKIFEMNHDAVMRWGGQGLAMRLGASVVDETATVRAQERAGERVASTG